MFRNSVDGPARQLLFDLAHGHTLKAHRDLDGHKVFRLYAPDGTARPIEREWIEPLLDRRLIGSNQKFPAATFWLTEAGRQLVETR
jgi:hypothetical protein